MIKLESVYFGQRNPNFDYEDFEIVKKVKRLAVQHQRQCENDCNGEGWVKGKYYKNNSPDAYIDDESIFNIVACEISAKIEKLIVDKKQFSVEFQGDPRGATVKLYYNLDVVDIW